MKRQEFSFPSATGVCTISACAYLPETEPEAVLAIDHEMAEHMERYEAFISFLCGHGVAVYMHDMASHGKSAGGGETGWFGEEDGWQRLIEDYRTVVRRAAAEAAGVARGPFDDLRGPVLGPVGGVQQPDDVRYLHVFQAFDDLIIHARRLLWIGRGKPLPCGHDTIGVTANPEGS